MGSQALLRHHASQSFTARRSCSLERNVLQWTTYPRFIARKDRLRHLQLSATVQQDKDIDYNQRMKQQMGWEHVNPYEYHYDRGLYYHEVDRNLLCGTMPRNVDDIDYLKEHEKIDLVLNLQQNEDFHYWNVDFHNIYHRAQSHGVNIVRCPAVDFDPHSLRKILPSAVCTIQRGMENGARIYVHCTAGLGRAPAVCIAFMYWFRKMQLDEAYQHVTSIRPCGPKRDAIRGATYDLIGNGHWDGFQHLPQDAFAFLNDEDRRLVQFKVLNAHH